MKQHALSIRPFIGAKDYQVSINFYKDAGFEVTVLHPTMCLIAWGTLSFYLQDYYVRDWIDNTMIFFQVEDVDQVWNELQALDLPKKYPAVRLKPIQVDTWGRECFLHDPSGVLLHFGEFH